MEALLAKRRRLDTSSDHAATQKSEPKIKHLDEKAIRLLRSGPFVPMVSNCVHELVANSLDADATKITIRVDLEERWVEVEDNGCGLGLDDLTNVGNRYHTSKKLVHESNSTTYGFRGEALASMREVGVLQVDSRTHSADCPTRRKLMRGKEESIKCTSFQRPTGGTTIKLYDLFRNMPVRRKNISKADMKAVRYTLSALALANPSVSFTLINSARGSAIFKAGGVGSMIQVFKQLFGTEKTNEMQPISATKGDIEVNGFMSQNTFHSRTMQFMFLNQRFVQKTRLHNATTYLFSKSQYWSSEASRNGRSCVYAINIKCPISMYDICFEPSKTIVEFTDWDPIIQCLAQAIQPVLGIASLPSGSYIETTNFLNDEEPEPDKTNEIPSKTNEVPPVLLESPSKDTPSSTSQQQPLSQFSYKTGRGISSSLVQSTLAPKKNSSHTLAVQNTHTLNQTQSALPKVPKSPISCECKSPRSKSPAIPIYQPQNAKNVPSTTTEVEKQHPVLLTHALSSKISAESTFDQKTKSGAACIFESTDVLVKTKWREPPTIPEPSEEEPLFLGTGIKQTAKSFMPLRITKEMFSRMRVLGQIDNKFIPCVLMGKGNKSNSVVMIDQHAAHERVRLERFIKEFSTPHTNKEGSSRRPILTHEIVDPPFHLDTLSPQEITDIKLFHEQFGVYGMEFSVPLENKVLIHKAPAALPLKKLEGFVKEQISFFNATSGASGVTIPRVIMDVLATNACHGAIKFGDPLTLEECKELIQDLALCDCPFQCAHGRPTVVPLTDLGDD
eukprot:m.40449 g.40449  ORF g.40449 m.40449 type:complete len:787 (+) comp9664_c0_seq2:124-2484(+)